MALTSELVSNAWYLSGIVSRAIEQPTADQINEGFALLNEVISERTIDEGTIPYTEKRVLTAVPGQEQYFIEDLVDIEVFVFYINALRYQTNNQSRQQFFGSFRPTNVQSLPWNWHMERTLNGANLFLYFKPDTDYPLEIWGSFRLTSVTLFQDLSLTLDTFYQTFLKYLLADRLCQEYSYAVPQNVATQLEKYYHWINNNTNVRDLRQRKLSSLSGAQAINWAVVNLGTSGWMPYIG